jgi:hypothetical protein
MSRRCKFNLVEFGKCRVTSCDDKLTLQSSSRVLHLPPSSVSPAAFNSRRRRRAAPVAATYLCTERPSLISPEVDTRFVCPREFGRPVTWVLPSFHGEPVKRNLSDTVLRNPCDATGVFSERLVFGIPEIQILVPLYEQIDCARAPCSTL